MMTSRIGKHFRTGLGAALALAWLLAACAPAPDSPVVFQSPEAAIDELSQLIGQNDPDRVEAVFGPGSVDLFSSGDPEADRDDFQRVGEMIEAGVEFEELDEDTVIALFGEAEWPWPIPLVREGEGWRFDTESGRDELLNRRIGHNELWTLAAMHEIVAAQQEYRQVSHDGLPRTYAQKFLSSEGQHDGLYWPAGEDEEPSPLGEFLADSEVRSGDGEARPFHGYHYRMLLKRGPDTPGGEMDYRDEDGLLTRGFGVLAWPAKYGNSGVMTFITNHRGIVYQKDLGEDTATAVEAIDSFNPDESWWPTPDTVMEAVDEE